MNNLKIAIGQINPKIADFEGNTQQIIAQSKLASEKGADLIVFPELCLCGYPPMDLLDHPGFVSENLRYLRVLQSQLPETMGVIVGYVDTATELAGKSLQNVCALIHQGRIIHRQAKTLLPTYDVFDEARYFAPANRWQPVEFKDCRIGIAICEDMWWESEPNVLTRYPIDPVKHLLDNGAQLIVVPSASPFYAEKTRIRLSLMERIGRGSGVPVVYVNTVGANDSLIFDGNSLATDGTGRLIHQSPGFAWDVSIVEPFRQNQPQELRVDRYEEIAQALRLGISDYLKKTGFSRVHLGLSGGIDSALVLTLAVQALGPERVSAFLLPSQYSSQGSIDDSLELARRLGIETATIPIQPVYSSVTQALEPHFQGREPDLAEENIQARIRGLLLMGYSNKFGSLVLTTGNKSELAVGYCTLYGDMAGSLAVIGDLFKTEVYQLCRHLNRDIEIIPEAIITKAPSAELRPDQRDQDSLPAYEILDEILKGFIIEHRTRTELIAQGLPEEAVDQVLKLLAASEYKRRQAPPVLKVSPRAFGAGRRIPIARSFYELRSQD
ncbi:NAD+ synthase [Spirochaeta lutea]|uniref:Glutamine-dependent NAD(+) synthetase n=1 Tax=Spirochaeta lutea TaxID=1480694 RepID=A0A098QVT4_9SPIO|nr:NAD+ synthase [Spirochaeta lutea]KGE71955.1 NAD+ synthetase [Spirochaeta lutea]